MSYSVFELRRLSLVEHVHTGDRNEIITRNKHLTLVLSYIMQTSRRRDVVSSSLLGFDPNVSPFLPDLTDGMNEV